MASVEYEPFFKEEKVKKYIESILPDDIKLYSMSEMHGCYYMALSRYSKLHSDIYPLLVREHLLHDNYSTKRIIDEAVIKFKQSFVSDKD